jgi:acyl carrier protein
MNTYRQRITELSARKRTYLASQLAARNAWVSDVHSSGTTQQLVAYIVPRDDEAVDLVDLRQSLEVQLPHYMIPSTFMVLEDLPLMPNGKLDRKALPMPDQTREDLDGNYVAPGNDVERKLAEIWQELLDIDRIGIHDNFFKDLGGHSLLATQVVSELGSALEMTIPTRSMFEHPTIAAFGVYLEDMVMETISESSGAQPDEYMDSGGSRSITEL